MKRALIGSLDERCSSVSAHCCYSWAPCQASLDDSTLLGECAILQIEAESR